MLRMRSIRVGSVILAAVVFAWARPSSSLAQRTAGADSSTTEADAQYADWVTPGDRSSADEIRRGEGAILRRGARKIAAYRDHAGELHECSAVCVHLGGLVSWNPLEKTWDCPCHGARYDRLGNVVNGPANGNLADVESEGAPES